MTWVSNKCGGARFRTLPDFRVEVENLGFPRVEPGSPRHKLLVQTWRNWGPLIKKWSRIRTQECLKQRKTPGSPGCALLPPSNILAIMTQETGFKSGDKREQAEAGSPAGAEGLMQIMPCRIFNPESAIGAAVCESNRKNPNDSVKVGSLILQHHLGTREGLPAAASNYNSGDLTCYKGMHEPNVFKWHHEQNYALKVAEYNNSAIDMGVNSRDLPTWAWILGGALAAGAGIYWTKRG